MEGTIQYKMNHYYLLVILTLVSIIIESHVHQISFNQCAMLVHLLSFLSSQFGVLEYSKNQKAAKRAG